MVHLFFIFWLLDSFFRSPSSDVENPGNNLYVTGLSPRVTKRELEKHFSAEGTVRSWLFFFFFFFFGLYTVAEYIFCPFVLMIEIMDYFISSCDFLLTLQVLDVHLVADPWTRESRGFGFITMSSNDEAERCIKYLNRSVLEGRIITVEKVNIEPSIIS